MSNKILSNKVLSNPLCDTCIKINKNKSHPEIMTSINIENWKDIPFHIPMLGNSNSSSNCQEVHIDLGKSNAGKLVYYFAANSKDLSDNKKKRYPNIYLNSNNNGLVLLDKNGCGLARVDCPSVYLDVPPKTFIKKGNRLQGYISHIHMLVSNKEITKWEDKMRTQNVLCKISKSEYQSYVSKGFRIVLNALGSEYNIHGTDGNLDYKSLSKLSGEQIRKLIYKISMNKSKNHKQLLSKVNVSNMPLIVYCYNPKCNAAKQLASELYRAGFYNILYYPDGFLGYHRRL